MSQNRHSAIGAKVEYADENGNKAYGIVTDVRKGPAMANGQDKVGSVRFSPSTELEVTPEDGSPVFWSGPYAETE